jgi:putative mRNA 3-end processing factor
MLTMTKQGLYCPGGDFYIDPKGAVDHAIITHAHSDHARRGSKKYYCTHSGVDLLKVRLGKNISIFSVPYGEKFRMKEVEVSFHPAGHILGSSQIRLESYGEVWVVSGDYKRDLDHTCEPFETVSCDVFVTEATFGTPAFVWDKSANFGEAIFEWWNNNIKKGFNSVLFAYSLGKAQRILGALHALTKQAVHCHPATEALNRCYRAQNIKLAPTICLDTIPKNEVLTDALILVPLSYLKTAAASVIGKRYKTAFASGWMVRQSNQYHAGFVMSDHADWDDLLLTVEQTTAKKVYVQHRGSGALVRELRSRGIMAYSDAALFNKNPNQLFLF